VKTSLALVCLPTDTCPECGGGLAVVTTWQPSLFLGCGYGEARAESIKRCHGCGWWMVTGHTAVNPREFR